MSIIREDSRSRLVWDVLILGLIVVSCILPPYQAAFEHQVTFSGSLIVYLLDLVFLFDIFLNFRTSYRERGFEGTENRRSAQHYQHSMFPVDLVASLPIDALFLLCSDIPIYGVSLVLVLRQLRLLRVVRLFFLFHRWENRSGTNSSQLRIVKFLLVVCVLTHWIACAWFLVPFTENFPPDSWAAREQIIDSDAATQYIRSLYWSVVTMTTVGYGDITPARNIEYIFTMVAMIIGASTYALIIGHVASLFSNWDSARADFWSRVDALNQFLRMRGVRSDLNERIRDYYSYIWAHYRGSMHHDLFADLPEPVRLELVFHLTKNLLEKVPLFQHCSPVLRDALLLKLNPQVYAPGTYIVREGETGDEIIFISRGDAEIVSGKEETRHGEFEGGDYFGHLSMVLGERRTASVRAVTYCDVFLLSRTAFNQIRDEYPEFQEVLKKASSEKTEKTENLVMAGVIL